MIDAVQLVLLLVIIILTILLVVLGIQVFFILKDLRQTIQKSNTALDHINSITENIEGPLEALSSFSLGIKASSFISIVKLVKGFLGRDKE